ncbi:1,4-alpha-glucan branching protein GlgB [Desulfopila sp. IMCC35008]|uniref:1,4-alpha-glucan branching protein GlgB n=1 Tax=Desulfopila sp. IMCC35008 TaxID=2653858 RepID=UPI00197AC154|nr:1,4-alpha-glucan branching protein GlgB [Desulfopila sp. IMCC35008]
MKEHIFRLLHSCHHDPFQFLGVHFNEDETRVTVRTFQPHARKVHLLAGDKQIEMECIDENYIYSVDLDRNWFADPDIDPYTYQFEVEYSNGYADRINDPYRFLPQLQETDSYLFNLGTNYRLYDHLGSHPVMLSGISGTIFRVWAPTAQSVSVLGNFNSWDGRVHPMRSLGGSGIWELFIPAVGEGELYKFRIRAASGQILEKSDPFQFRSELRPSTASIVSYLDNYSWNDREWQNQKNTTSPYNTPLSIYELHPGSWKKDPDDPERFLTFIELADQLIPYVKEMGFTHIELLPIMEHPLDESWGYQVTGPFSVTSRHGIPQDFMHFVDRCHQESIGVILDWVPAHFPKDAHSLARFDGTALFEHEDPRKGDHPEWGTYIYNYGRREVSNYLIASALFWLDKYHIDGLRVDAVASMLYLDYSRQEGEWIPNCYGGRENLEAIEFLKHANSIIFELYPNTLMIAEESTSFYGVSKPTDQGGLGFNFKWNMGWMNDILSYFSKDPIFRKFHHNVLTFSIMYAFSENFVLPLSHDEIVHGKNSLLSKMPGDEWQKFANLRLLLFYMWTHPGKKLLFMGGEFGQYNEWNCKQSLDWHLLEKPGLHQRLNDFVKSLNSFYARMPPLFELDFDHQGFTWVDLEDRDRSIISFVRHASNKEEHLVCLLNFTPETHYGYRTGFPTEREYQLVFSSDDTAFGGSDVETQSIVKPEVQPHGQVPFSCEITVPPLCGLVYKPR